jgi:hypothetical protein
MRALKIQHGMVINFPQHKTREQEVDIFDCYIGQTVCVSKMNYEHLRMADQGLYGPAPRKRPRTLSFFEEYDIEERSNPVDYEGIGHHRQEEDHNFHDLGHDEGRDAGEKRECYESKESNPQDEDELHQIPAVSSTLYLPNGQQVVFGARVVRPK